MLQVEFDTLDCNYLRYMKKNDGDTAYTLCCSKANNTVTYRGMM